VYSQTTLRDSDLKMRESVDPLSPCFGNTADWD